MALTLKLSWPMVMSLKMNDHQMDGADDLARDEYALTVTNHMRFEIDSVPI
jgi:hypothetical protein